VLQVCATKKVCRYHPTEVKAGMAALARAQEQLQAACGAAWTQLLRDFTAAHHAAFRAAVAAVAQLDALHGLAVVASSPGYCRPQVCGAADSAAAVFLLVGWVVGLLSPPTLTYARTGGQHAPCHLSVCDHIVPCGFLLQFVNECEPQRLAICEGKHPMLDVVLDGAAVPNSLDLRWDGKRAAVITGWVL
jgi:DNA mismatch repair ATPase MutS